MADEQTPPPDSTPIDLELDPVLQIFTNLANKSGLSFGITLMVDGLVISGFLISATEYYEGVSESWGAAWPQQELRESMQALLAKLKENATPSPGNEYEAQHIHLRAAQIFSSNGGTIPSRSAMFWRGRLRSVDGWWFGNLTAE